MVLNGYILYKSNTTEKKMSRLQFTSAIIGQIEEENMTFRNMENEASTSSPKFALEKLPGRNLRQCASYNPAKQYISIQTELKLMAAQYKQQSLLRLKSICVLKLLTFISSAKLTAAERYMTICYIVPSLIAHLTLILYYVASRIQKILANARKLKGSESEDQDVNKDQFNISETSSNNRDYLKDNLPPEYYFLCDEEFDDCEKDPDFNPSSSDESEESVSNSPVKSKLLESETRADVQAQHSQRCVEITGGSTLKGKNEENDQYTKKKNEIDSTVRRIVIDLQPITRSSEILLPTEERENGNIGNNTDSQNQMPEKVGDTNRFLESESNFDETDNPQEELENAPSGAKKPRRTLERQMKNNKEKHPLKDPCICKMKCWKKFSFEGRQNIHEDYWDMNRHIQRLRTSLTNSNGNKRLVPRKDQRGRHPPPNKKDRNLLIADVNSYNPLPSHYAREHAPNRKYLPPDLTIKFMHNDYNSTHPDFKVCYGFTDK
nr:unnamed protein product [Callosobruchus chinensis]